MTDQMTAPVREVAPIRQIVTDDLARNRVAVAVLRDTRNSSSDMTLPIVQFVGGTYDRPK